jgi:hypothetical protein
MPRAAEGLRWGLCMRRSLLVLLVAGILATYPVVGFYPFAWESPIVHNEAERTAEGWLVFAGPGLASAPAEPDWAAQITDASPLEAHLRVLTASTEQHGPARLFTVSLNPWLRNLTLGQQGADLVLRVRTPQTDLNAMPESFARGIFTRTQWLDLSLRLSPDEVSVWVGGELALRQPLPPGTLATWNPSYRLGLGNELTGDRPWLGTIAEARVQVGERAIDLLSADTLALPPLLRRWHHRPLLFTARVLTLSDVVINLLGFVPLGLVLGVWLRRRRAGGLVLGALLAMAMSLAIEVGQVWLPGRFPSLLDLALNTAGGVLGLALARSAPLRRLVAELEARGRGRKQRGLSRAMR